MEEINTDRLVLRGFRDEDADDLFEFLYQLRDDEFEGYPGITRQNCEKQLACRVGSDEYYAIQLKETGKVIGNIYLGNRDYNTKETGYIINENYRRRGYALEALTAVINQAFSSGVHRIYAECDPRNTRSVMLLEKAGLRREAHMRRTVYFHKDANGDPIWKDTYVYAVLDTEFDK